MTPKKPKVAITDYTFSDLTNESTIVTRAGAELLAYHCASEEDVIDAAWDADAVLVQWAPITSSVIDRLTKCKVIVRYGIGVDNVDLKAAQKHGITVCNVPDYCIDEVADHTLSLALNLIRQVNVLDRALHQGLWHSLPPTSMQAPSQMIFATVGFGRTAKAVLERARSFRFRLATCDPYISIDKVSAQGVEVLPLHTLLSTADVISLHVPLSTETNHLIDSAALSTMKSSAILINTARGGLIDTDALATALSNGTIAGAGLDVFESEPLDPSHPLLACQNAILTPHIAWYSKQSVESLQTMAAEEVIRALAGKNVRSKIV